MKKLTLSLSLVTGLVSPLAAQLELGAEAPDVAVAEWINHRSVTPSSLEGRVVCYAFVRLEDDECLFWLERWDAVRARFALDPVSFVVITNESPKFVRETCDTEDIKTPFAIDPGDLATRAFDVQLFPSVFVVGAAGTVGFFGQPGEDHAISDAITELVDAARAFPDLGKKMKSVNRHLTKWELAKAITAIDKELGGKKIDDATRLRLSDTKVMIAQVGDELTAIADEAIAEERWPIAVTALTRLSVEHAGLDGADDAAGKLDELKANEELKREITAAVEFAKGKRYERDRNWKAAHKTFDSLSKIHKETKAGQAAAELAVFLKGRAKRR